MEPIIDQPTNFDEVHQILRGYVPPIRSRRGAYTLERMKKLMEYLGDPQESYKVIHVAGTSGKTSTCHYIASMLKQAGKKAGLSVSPHVDELNERVQVNLRPLTEKTYCKEFGVFLRLVKKSGIKPTYFEMLTAFSMWEFKRLACEYVVLEVGLGGLLDATNVVQNKKKLAVITDIGLDHQEVLGKTLTHIASQKAGIIKPYNTVICYEQNDEVMQVIREVAQQVQAELHEVWSLRASDLPHDLPLFQRRNWYLALSAYNVLATQYGLPDLDEHQLASSTLAYIPARMELLTIDGKVVIMDGAHNQQKLTALVSSLRAKYKNESFDVLLSFVTTKHSRIKDCLEILLPITKSLIITTFATENQEKISVEPLKIAEICEELEFNYWEVIVDPVQAFQKLLDKPTGIKLITGSFYLLNHVRPLVRSHISNVQ